MRTRKILNMGVGAVREPPSQLPVIWAVHEPAMVPRLRFGLNTIPFLTLRAIDALYRFNQEKRYRPGMGTSGVG